MPVLLSWAAGGTRTVSLRSALAVSWLTGPTLRENSQPRAPLVRSVLK